MVVLNPLVGQCPFNLEGEAESAVNFRLLPAHKALAGLVCDKAASDFGIAPVGVDRGSTGLDFETALGPLGSAQSGD